MYLWALTRAVPCAQNMLLLSTSPLSDRYLLSEAGSGWQAPVCIPPPVLPLRLSCWFVIVCLLVCLYHRTASSTEYPLLSTRPAVALASRRPPLERSLSTAHRRHPLLPHHFASPSSGCFFPDDPFVDPTVRPDCDSSSASY